MRRYCFSGMLFLLLSTLGFATGVSYPPLSSFDLISYPHFYRNPYLNSEMRQRIIPHLLPVTHPAMDILDSLFSQDRVTENLHTFSAAGFEMIDMTSGSFVIVARHPALSGYVLKIYLDSEKRIKKEKPHWEWLLRRCIGAKRIKELIQEKQIKYFVVPDKWIYILPPISFSERTKQPILVIETDMQVQSKEKTIQAWKTQMTPRRLQELFLIFKHGCGSTHVDINVPYTHKGVFAFIDTENPYKGHDLKKVRKYLSKEMQKYWDRLISN